MKIFQSKFIFGEDWRYKTSRHFLFWVSIILFHTLIYGMKGLAAPSGYPWENIMLISLLEAIYFTPHHLFTTYTFLYFLIPKYLLKGKYIPMLLGACVTMLIGSVFSYFITEVLVVPLRNALGFYVPNSGFFFGLMSGLRGGTTAVGFATMIKLSKYFLVKHWYSQQLEKEKLKVELRLLRSQLHPHFLFNTLNNLYGLVLAYSASAPQVILKLSALLRYLLYECNTMLVSVKKEKEFIENYVSLEKLRYEERLEVSLNFDGIREEQKVAPMLFLPLLENAFKHGVNEQLDQAWIFMELSVNKNQLVLKLLNSKLENQKVDTKIRGIGIQNIIKRLKLLYPNKHQLILEDQGEIFFVRLEITLDGYRPPLQEQGAVSEIQPYLNEKSGIERVDK